MKNNITVLSLNNKFIIEDISLYLLHFLNFDTTSKIIGTELTIPFLINHLQLLESSTVKYIEFFYRLENTIFKIQILKAENKQYTISLEDSNINLEISEDFENSYINTSFDFIDKDKDLVEIINLKNKDTKTIQLEMIFLLKKIKEEIKELQNVNEKQEDKFIEKDSLSLSFVIDKLGFKNILLFIFVLSIIESIFIEPFIQPVVKNIATFFEESFTEN